MTTPLPPRGSNTQDARPAPPLAPPPEARARFEELAYLLSTEGAAIHDDRDLRAVLLYELAEIDERVRGDEPGAARGYLAAFNARAAFRPPLDALIRLYARRRSTSNLSKLFDALLKAAQTPRERAEALCLRGELLADRAGDEQAALQAFEAAAAADPGYRVAWLNLQRAGLRLGDRALVLRAVEHLASLTSDPEHRSLLLQELAEEHARSGTREGIDDAVRCLREAASLERGRWRSLVELERLSEQHDRPGDLAEALESRAKLAQRIAEGHVDEGASGTHSLVRTRSRDEALASAADLWTRAAWVRLVALHDAEGAHAAIDQACLCLPNDARYRFLAMTVADQTGEIDRASTHAAWLLERDFADGVLRASLHFRLAESAAMRGDAPEAIAALQTALSHDPSSAAARGALIEQLVAVGDGMLVVQEFDRLAEASEPGPPRASLRRAAAMLALALRYDRVGAVQRLRLACDDDPADVSAQRALVWLQGAALDGDNAARAETAKARATAIDALLAHASDGDERAALLSERFFIERHDLRDFRAAAKTAEQLVEATHESLWAMESAAHLWAAVGELSLAARWASAIAERDSLPGGADESRAWRAIAARWFWAAGESVRARDYCLAAHREHPSDDYLTALALRILLATRETTAAIEVATRRAAAATDDATAARWLVVAGAPLSDDDARTLLEAALARDPRSPAVVTAALAATRWRGDVGLRAKVTDAQLSSSSSHEALALGVELALVRAFVDHDLVAANEVLERVVGLDGAAVAPVLLRALARGAFDGADSDGAVAAWQAVLSAIPSGDPLATGVELEIARALSASAATRDQAATARELAEGDHPQLIAPRVLALLDAVQRERRDDVPKALRRLAEQSDGHTADALRSFAIASLRAQGRSADARALATQYPDLAASILCAHESSGSVDRAEEHLAAIQRRAALSHTTATPTLSREEAVWASLARADTTALERAQALVLRDPHDLVALDVMRCAGRRARRWNVVVDACAALAARVHAPERAAAYWEEAGVVAATALEDTTHAETYLRAALDAVPTLDLAYRKLREILEARRDSAALEALVTRRAAAVTDERQRIELLWEQARLRRALGLREGALESALKVVASEHEHVAARALIAEIHAASGRLAETAEALAALAACREAPRAQRVAARIGAADLFDLRLGDPQRAIDQLDALVTEGEADDVTLERGYTVAAQAGLWPAALRFAIQAAERAPAGTVRAAAMLRVIELHRDQLSQPEAAAQAARRAHEAYPSDLAILKALHALVPNTEHARSARATIDALREEMRVDGVTLERVASIAEAARSGGDLVLERLALRLASALGRQGATPSLDVPSRGSLRDPALVLRYRHAADTGRAVTLLEMVLPELATLCGASTDALDVGWTDKVKGSHPLRTALAPLLRAVGSDDFEVYISSTDRTLVAVVGTTPLAVVLGASVTAPFDTATRHEITRRALLALRGAAALAHQGPEAITEKALAAMSYAELPMATASARFEHQFRNVGKAMSRRGRRAVAESARALAASPDAWNELVRAARAMRATARRGALAVSGFVEGAARETIAAEGLGEREVIDLFSRDAVGRELALFCVGDALAHVVRELGTDRK